MIHKRMLITAIVLIVCGLILWLIAPLLIFFGVGSYTTGQWGWEVQFYTTPLYWVGVAIYVIGEIGLVAGVILLPITIILEYKDRKKRSAFLT